jgi:hypothetical protein
VLGEHALAGSPSLRYRIVTVPRFLFYLVDLVVQFRRKFLYRFKHFRVLKVSFLPYVASKDAHDNQS